ncbi:hypothetical protein [Undibacterium sp. Ji22W]|uniref:hypothetical protein n=1 Tax=Undibacterium sp. Ji22W TaxID=3413038 RepID=UPI003BF1C6BF
MTLIRRSSFRFPSLLLVLGVFAFVFTLTACSTTAVNTRMQYWRDEIKMQLPIGTNKRQAEEFFAARGAELKCCVSMSRDKKFHYISERKVGYSLLMEYDVVVLVEISSAENVTSVSVQSWGMGF